MASCFNCGHELVWDNDFSRSDVEGFEFDEDDDYVINFLHCPNCHCIVEVYHPSNNQLKEYEDETEH